MNLLVLAYIHQSHAATREGACDLITFVWVPPCAVDPSGTRFALPHLNLGALQALRLTDVGRVSRELLVNLPRTSIVAYINR